MLHSDLHLTPLYHHSRGGSLKHKPFLFAMYAIGLKTPQDAMHHWMGCGEESAKNWNRMLRIACGFAELHTGRSVQHPAGIVELDATKTVIKPGGKKHKAIASTAVEKHALRPLHRRVPQGHEHVLARALGEQIGSQRRPATTRGLRGGEADRQDDIEEGPRLVGGLCGRVQESH